MSAPKFDRNPLVLVLAGGSALAQMLAGDMFIKVPVRFRGADHHSNRKRNLYCRGLFFLGPVGSTAMHI